MQVWESKFSDHDITFLANHRVGTVSLLPATCYIVMARAAVYSSVHSHAPFALTDLAFMSMMFLDTVTTLGSPNVQVAAVSRVPCTWPALVVCRNSSGPDSTSCIRTQHLVRTQRLVPLTSQFLPRHAPRDPQLMPRVAHATRHTPSADAPKCQAHSPQQSLLC